MKMILALSLRIAMSIAVVAVAASITAYADSIPFAAYGSTSASANAQSMSKTGFGSISATGSDVYFGFSLGSGSATGSASYSNGEGSASGNASASCSGTYAYLCYDSPSRASGSGETSFTVVVIGPESVFGKSVPLDFTASGSASTGANEGGYATATASFSASLYQYTTFLGTSIGKNIGACDDPSYPTECSGQNAVSAFSFSGQLNVESSYFSSDGTLNSFTQAIVDLSAGCGGGAGFDSLTQTAGSMSCSASADPMVYIDPTFNSEYNNEFSLAFSPNPPGSTTPTPEPSSLLLLGIGLLSLGLVACGRRFSGSEQDS